MSFLSSFFSSPSRQETLNASHPSSDSNSGIHPTSINSQTTNQSGAMSSPTNVNISRPSNNSKGTTEAERSNHITPKASRKSSQQVHSSSSESEDEGGSVDGQEELGGAGSMELKRKRSGGSDDSSLGEESDDSNDENGKFTKRSVSRHDAKRQKFSSSLTRQKYQLMKRTNKQYEKEIKALQKKLKAVENNLAKSDRALQVLRSSHGKSRNKKVIDEDPEVKRYKSQLRSFIKYDLGRRMKFLPKGYSKWSDKAKSICQLVIKALNWPPGTSDDEKMDMWQRVLAPSLKRMISDYKNKIWQPMKKFTQDKNCTVHQVIEHRR